MSHYHKYTFEMRHNLCFIYWFLEYILCKLEKEIKSLRSPLLLDP